MMYLSILEGVPSKQLMYLWKNKMATIVVLNTYSNKNYIVHCSKISIYPSIMLKNCTTFTVEKTRKGNAHKIYLLYQIVQDNQGFLQTFF